MRLLLLESHNHFWWMCPSFGWKSLRAQCLNLRNGNPTWVSEALQDNDKVFVWAAVTLNEVIYLYYSDERIVNTTGYLHSLNYFFPWLPSLPPETMIGKYGAQPQYSREVRALLHEDYRIFGLEAVFQEVGRLVLRILRLLISFSGDMSRISFIVLLFVMEYSYRV